MSTQTLEKTLECGLSLVLARWFIVLDTTEISYKLVSLLTLILLALAMNLKYHIAEGISFLYKSNICYVYYDFVCHILLVLRG